MEKIKNFFHHLFVPNENNNYRAKSLHPDFLGLYLIFALVISFFFKQVSTNVLGYATDISVNKLFELTNQQREKNGLKDLKYNSELAQAAYAKAQDMFAENYWAHYSPTGKTPWDFILASGYKYEYAGENLAKNFLFSSGVVDAWMNSPSHRENILNDHYTDVGFSVVNGILNGEQTTLVVQMFGSPLAPAVADVTTPPDNIQPQPVKVKTPVESGGAVLAKSANNNKSFLNFPAISFNMNIVFMAFLLIALSLDFYFASKFEVFRVNGKNIAHFIFILFILIGLITIAKGAIL